MVARMDTFPQDIHTIAFVSDGTSQNYDTLPYEDLMKLKGAGLTTTHNNYQSEMGRCIKALKSFTNAHGIVERIRFSYLSFVELDREWHGVNENERLFTKRIRELSDRCAFMALQESEKIHLLTAERLLNFMMEESIPPQMFALLSLQTIDDRILQELLSALQDAEARAQNQFALQTNLNYGPAFDANSALNGIGSPDASYSLLRVHRIHNAITNVENVIAGRNKKNVTAAVVA